MTPQLYTASRLRVLRSCLRLHYYRYTLGIRGAETEIMRFGTVGHKALEAWYRAWMDGKDRLVAALAECDALAPFDRVKLRALVVAYDQRWGGENWEVLAVEVEFRYQLGDFLIGGKIDAIIRDLNDGRIYVVEHKTTAVDASTGSAYWEKLAIDTQVSIYIDGAAAALGYTIDGCIYDVLKRPLHEQLLATPLEKREYTTGRGCKRCGGSAKAGGIERGRGSYSVVFGAEVKDVECSECAGTGWKLNKDSQPEAPRLYAKMREADETLAEFEERVVNVIAESPDNFLLRGVAVRLDDELPAMRADLVDAIKLERASALFDLHPRNPDACARFGQLCHMFAACSGRASIDDRTLFPRSGAHPELAAA